MCQMPPSLARHPLSWPLGPGLPFLSCPGAISWCCSVTTLFLTLWQFQIAALQPPSPSPSPRACLKLCPVFPFAPAPQDCGCDALTLGLPTLDTAMMGTDWRKLGPAHLILVAVLCVDWVHSLKAPVRSVLFSPWFKTINKRI